MTRESIGRPSYIGYFAMESGLSVFELYLFKKEKGNISGKILDIFGVSTFKGNIQPNIIYFEKKYDDRAIQRNPELIKGGIIFKGKKRNSQYFGEYYSIEDKFKGIFVLEKSGKSKTLEFLINRVISKGRKL